MWQWWCLIAILGAKNNVELIFMYSSTGFFILKRSYNNGIEIMIILISFCDLSFINHDNAGSCHLLTKGRWTTTEKDSL